MEKLANYKSYKNSEYIYSLSNKELIDYYNCYGHHHFSRKFCKSTNSIKDLNLSGECPCTCEHGKKHDHFCTGLSLNTNSLNESDVSFEKSSMNCDCDRIQEKEKFNAELLSKKFYTPSITVCENFPPSFTLKEDQLTLINKDINLIKHSKALMRKNLKDLDKLLDETSTEKKLSNKNDGLNEVERFYRSDKFIGSSMNIKSLKHNLPRTDIRPSKYVTELKELELSGVNMRELELMNSNSIYSFRSKDIFTDSDILANRRKLQKPLVDPLLKLRPKTAIIHRTEL